MRPYFADLGTVSVVEVYDYYDEPVLLLCRNELDQLFLVTLSADSRESQAWLYCPMSPRRLQEVRSGGISLYDAFATAEGGRAFEVTVSKTAETPPVGRWRSVDTFSPQELPLQGERLNLPTPTQPQWEPDSVQRMATQTRHETVAIRLSIPDRTRNDAPAALLGRFLSAIQSSLVEIGQTLLSKSARAGVVDQTGFSVARTAGASFVVELRADTSADLFGESTAAIVIERLLLLLRASPNEEQLLSALKELKGKSATRFRDLLLSLGSSGEIDVVWGSARPGGGGSVRLTGADALSAAEIIGRMSPQVPFEYDVTGQLIGANTRTHVFEFWDPSEKRQYTGKFEPDALSSVDGGAVLNAFYVATIRETPLENVITGEMDGKFHLLRLRTN